ncbi:MAG: cyclic nucleotide-binding domain-containing protein [Planctomycetaceae bacterium]|jgi:Fe-S-cluster-containing dehydrogenase component/CRP-like cAMP-binding protein
MSSSSVQISRPERWGVPFSDQMTDADVDRLLSLSLFSSERINSEKFSNRIPLAGILKNDARLRQCTTGEIIIREGDWGNSAFFLLSGSIRIEIERGRHAFPAELLGRSPVRRKSFFGILSQLWNRSRHTEQRDLSTYAPAALAGSHGRGKDTRVYLQDFSTVIDRYKTTRVEAVEFFGEQSALGRIERTASVFADGDCELLEIRWQGIRDIISRVPWLRERIDERFRTWGLRVFLRNSPYFEHLQIDEETTSAQKEHIDRLSRRAVREAEFASYGSFDKVDRFTRLVESGNATNLEHEAVIAGEGNAPDGVILIRSGIARVSYKYNHGHRTISYLTPGQAFGVDEVVEGWRSGNPVHLRHSLRAVGYVTAVVIPTAVFEEVVLNECSDYAPGPLPSASPSSSSVRSPQMDPGLLEFLVERRFVNGTASMVIDLDRCTRCDDCVRACAATHDNNPRFLRHGPIHGRHMVANACMHCADPVCMIQCPTGAIHRNVLEGQVVINDQSCIGCSACANNCPYDAIRMVQIRDEKGHLVYPTHTSAPATDGANGRLPITPSMKEWEPIEKATKCDLCADQISGPACLNACPHDALIRLDLGNHDTATEWLNR